METFRIRGNKMHNSIKWNITYVSDQIQYCGNVVQHTQFLDSFLFLGCIISNSNLVFATLKYPFDTEHNDTY